MKKIAVLVRGREEEALRMGLGLTILNDRVDVFILDRKLPDTENIRLNLGMMKEMGLSVSANTGTNAGTYEGIEYLSTDEIAEKLLEYDHILPY